MSIDGTSLSGSTTALMLLAAFFCASAVSSLLRFPFCFPPNALRASLAFHSHVPMVWSRWSGQLLCAVLLFVIGAFWAFPVWLTAFAAIGWDLVVLIFWAPFLVFKLLLALWGRWWKIHPTTDWSGIEGWKSDLAEHARKVAWSNELRKAGWIVLGAKLLLGAGLFCYLAPALPAPPEAPFPDVRVGSHFIPWTVQMIWMSAIALGGGMTLGYVGSWLTDWLAGRFAQRYVAPEREGALSPGEIRNLSIAILLGYLVISFALYALGLALV